MKTKEEFLQELKEANRSNIPNYYGLEAGEVICMIKESEESIEPLWYLIGMAFDLGFHRGEKYGRNKEKAERRSKARKTRKLQGDREETIRELYSPEEVETLLKRLNKKSLADLTARQALRIISKRA